MLGCWRRQTQQPTIDRKGEVEWWSRSRRLTGGNTTTSRGRREQEAAARLEVKMEAKTEAKTEVQTATMKMRLLVATKTSATQIKNQPTMGASECG